MREKTTEVAILLMFLLVTYPVIQLMTKVMGRSWMFQWRHQLFDSRGREKL